MESSLAGVRVLIVDDNTLNLKLFSKLIAKWGAMTATAENGKQAVDMVRQHQENLTPYHVIIMDLQMPVMDGATACRTIREFDQSVVILAASANELLKEEMMLSGFTDCVLKPFDTAQLHEKLIASIT
ncbi:Hybrid signal transduction histidine kinase I [Fibrisoma limi BUZ 3]|uniref:Hybrid signal transduction histidine kinase I n=1 Tax=Fibrisoma limi BUZ 3 TaxID=1185876 RepID=I2GJR0_9BACT|nr:response regulator [Fibrisoma limi]CCH54135.1 Hybrid signal transduction histidine kinase I [Fibrisoma limi BUZ 3]